VTPSSGRDLGFLPLVLTTGIVAIAVIAGIVGRNSYYGSFDSASARPFAPSVLVGEDDAPVSVAESLLVHVEGVRGPFPAAFASSPDRGSFSRLPVARGVGFALREKPLSSSPVWLAFSVRNVSPDEDWALIADGAGFRPSAAVIVAEDGSREYYSGDALARRRVAMGVRDIAAYRLSLPPGLERAVYLRFDNGGPFGSGLRLRPAAEIADLNESIVGLTGAIAGFSVAACAAYAFASTRFGITTAGGTKRHRLAIALKLAYPAFASVAILLGRNGGGVSALLGGVGMVRYAASIAFGVAALAAEAAIASLSAGAVHPTGIVASRMAYAAILCVFAFSAGSPAYSFVLPAGLALLVVVSAAREAFGHARSARRGIEEAERLASKLDAETSGGRDFMMATAAALRGPLHGLMGILEDLDALSADIPGIPRQASSGLSLARAEAARLENLVSNILSYSGMGPARLVVEDMDLASVARAAAGLLRVALAGRGVRIDVSAPVIEIRSDLGFAHRLLYTAMNRASQTSGARTVRVSATSDDRVVTLSVSDDGKAADESGAGPRSPAPDMDLVVMTRLANVMGGSFELRRAGGLNVHTIVLPRQAPLRTAEREGDPSGRRLVFPDSVDLDESPSRSPASPYGRVLVAGNEPVALLATKRRLEASAWRVDVTVSAEDALARVLRGDPYDIVIIESAMPEMSGFRFCESVRATRGPESVPIIVLTEAGRPDEIEMAFKSGANDYIARPVSGIELAARVKTHVDLAASVKRELRQAASMAEFDKYRTLAMLSAGVAHEINTPNNAVLRNVPMLKEIWDALESVVERLNREEDGFHVRGFGYDDLKRDIPDILNDLYMGAQDIKKIVEGLKDYARAPSESSAASLVDANDSVRYSARLLKHSIAVSTERFGMELAENLPPVRADRLKLTQVVVNVLENGLQALPDKRGGVSVSTALEDDETYGRSVAIRVVDDGVGMSAETLASVFEPFFTTKRDRGGSGLGMAVASGIVHDMGGSIELVSAPGAGTTATIRIPAAGGMGDDDDGR
jgi:signal transduction histidine kinase